MSDYYVKELVVNLSLAKANEIISAALNLGREADLLPLCVAVLDAGGNLVAFQREDGSGIVRQDAVLFWVSLLYKRLYERPLRDQYTTFPYIA